MFTNQAEWSKFFPPSPLSPFIPLYPPFLNCVFLNRHDAKVAKVAKVAKNRISNRQGAKNAKKD
ncbi:MAG: hypothetical protein KKA36_06250 [Gammaproteobacteria bacterium]|nr:hypothetical protein [Gammaproteobacteria bacterium]MBU2478674.1 hypothetical protein [Gammaproteobacteria bacterium]